MFEVFHIVAEFPSPIADSKCLELDLMDISRCGFSWDNKGKVKIITLY